MDSKVDGEKIVFDVPTILGASKSISYKNQIEAQFTALFRFYTSKQLINIDCFDNNGKLKKDLIIKAKDLTPAGINLASKAVPSWFRARDKDNNYSNLSILEKSLQEQKN